MILCQDTRTEMPGRPKITSSSVILLVSVSVLVSAFAFGVVVVFQSMLTVKRGGKIKGRPYFQIKVQAIISI